MSRRLTLEESLLFVPSILLLLVYAALAFLLPLTPGEQLLFLLFLLAGACTTAWVLYRTVSIGLRRQYPLTPLVVLVFSLLAVLLLHRHFPAVALPLFIVIAGTGAIWGYRRGFLFGGLAAAGYAAAVLILEPFTWPGLLTLTTTALHFLFVGALTGWLASQEQARRAEIETVNRRNVQLAQTLQRVNAALEVQLAARDAEVRKAQRLHEELFEMITHDLKSPLGTMLSALFILREALPPDAQNAHQAVGAALKAGERQMELIEDILDVQRFRAGALPLTEERVEAAALLREIADQFEPRVERKAIQIERRFAAALPAVRADRQILARVVANLLENAYKFTPPRGRITMDAQPRGRHLRVVVADTGPGIPGPQRQDIFQKYFQVTAGDAAARDGVGVGLAFCKLAVQALGGEIGVGTSPGGGAQFEFTIPLAESEDAPPGPA
jgi:signal transduction histidine kinase